MSSPRHWKLVCPVSATRSAQSHNSVISSMASSRPAFGIAAWRHIRVFPLPSLKAWVHSQHDVSPAVGSARLRACGLHKRSDTRPFKGEPVTNLSNDPFLQRLHEMNARVASRQIRLLEIEHGDITRLLHCAPIFDDVGDNAPLGSDGGADRLRIEKKSLSASGTGTIGPDGEDTVPGNEAARENAQCR